MEYINSPKSESANSATTTPNIKVVPIYIGNPEIGAASRLIRYQPPALDLGPEPYIHFYWLFTGR